MLLYCCIVIAATIVSTAYAESASNQAISSQSYERGDVPLFYKHDVIHVYTTNKPHVYTNQPQQQYHQPPSQPQTEHYRHIQYAPLPLKNLEHHKEVKSNTDTYSANIENNVTSEPQQEQPLINFIEPQIPTQASVVRTNFVQYAPLYNLDLKSLHNHMIQDRFHRNPSLLIKNKQASVNYLQPQLSHHNPKKHQDAPQNTKIVSQQHSKSNAVYPNLGHQIIQSDKYNGNIVQSNESIGMLLPVFYVKAPKVLLNVARTHNIARAPQKAYLDVNSSFRKLPSLPQEFFHPQSVDSRNPRMHPSPKTNIYMIRRTV